MLHLISIYNWALIIVVTAVTNIGIRLCHIFLRKDTLRKRAHRIGHWWAKTIMRGNPLWSTWVTGLEHIDPSRTYIYAANHTSIADIFVMYLTNAQFKWVAKESLFKIPLLGGCLRYTGHISLKRDDLKSIKEINHQMSDFLKKGMSLCLFPEGTRSPDGKLRAFKNGAFKTAIQHKVPVVPVVIKGTHDAIPKGGWVFRHRVKMELIICPPIETKDLALRDFKQLRDQVHQIIATIHADVTSPTS